MRAEIHEVVLTATEPLRAAWGTLRERHLFVLEIEGSDGIVGYGEAAPLAHYDGVGLDDVRAALEAHVGVLRERAHPAGGMALLEACRRAADLPQALAAVDMALWDRAGKREGLPLCSADGLQPAGLGAGQRVDRGPGPSGRRRRGGRRGGGGLRVREGQGRHRRRRRADRGGPRRGRAGDGDPARRQRRVGRRGGGAGDRGAGAGGARAGRGAGPRRGRGCARFATASRRGSRSTSRSARTARWPAARPTRSA